MPYPSHSHVVVLFVSVPWLLERKRSIISTQVASKSNQHLKKKKVKELVRKTQRENPKQQQVRFSYKLSSIHSTII